MHFSAGWSTLNFDGEERWLNMEHENRDRQVNPRRRRKTKKQIFMEVYLPGVLFGALVLLTLGCVIAGLTAGNSDDHTEDQGTLTTGTEAAENKHADRDEAERLMAEARHLANSYDFEGAIDVLDSFGKKIYDHDDMLQLRDHYKATKKDLVTFTGRDVVHLSVQVLIAEPERAFADQTYGSSYKRNFISTREFSNLLQQLYTNGYVLIDMDDIVDRRTDENGNTLLVEKTVMLPRNKKPLMLTQTQVNYYTYMVDPDKDGIPDKRGAGFASKLLCENGKFRNELISASGDTLVGNFDMVPILEEFLVSHPDFSYRGARAILAVTGYDGIFGYRGDDLANAKPLAEALKQAGYQIAYYTYYNSDYGSVPAHKIQDELERWNQNIVPVLGHTPYMVYALSGDIAKPNTGYSGEKFGILQREFCYYLGFCTDGKPWFRPDAKYIRMGRILANAENLQRHPEWFTGICDPATVLAEDR